MKKASRKRISEHLAAASIFVAGGGVFSRFDGVSSDALMIVGIALILASLLIGDS